jgi:PTH1 family peptidyl-tRNA hydrolase
MHLIVGLGNPGPEHRGHRHNIGFMAADAIAERNRFPAFRRKFQGEFSDTTIGGERVLLLKPMTFMNRSGDAVAAAMRFYKLAPEDVTVIYDEIDLAPGKVKVKTGGGSGGHNGIRSIDAHIGNRFRRVRLGIGHPGHKDLVNRHVLADFAKSDRDWVEPLLAAVADNAVLLARGDEPNFMNKVALALQQADAGPPDTDAPSAPTARPRSPGPDGRPSKSGPLAEMLGRLFGSRE